LIRCLSLWQPWATLVWLELKINETRDWATRPGPLAIHAAKKKFNPDDYERAFVAQLEQDGVDWRHLDYGCVLCIVDVLACRKTETVREQISPRERMYGNYGDGRWAWQTKMLRKLEQPIPFLGHQGLFAWPEGDKYVAGLAQPSLNSYGPLFQGSSQ
jgi:hypothetical protein